MTTQSPFKYSPYSKPSNELESWDYLHECACEWLLSYAEPDRYFYINYPLIRIRAVKKYHYTNNINAWNHQNTWRRREQPAQHHYHRHCPPSSLFSCFAVGLLLLLALTAYQISSWWMMSLLLPAKFMKYMQCDSTDDFMHSVWLMSYSEGDKFIALLGLSLHLFRRWVCVCGFKFVLILRPLWISEVEKNRLQSYREILSKNTNSRRSKTNISKELRVEISKYIKSILISFIDIESNSIFQFLIFGNRYFSIR